MPIPNSEDCRDHINNGDRIFVSYTAVFGFLIAVLVNLVAANVEGTDMPLFEKHAINMWSFLVALGGYCVALAADFNSRIYQSNSNSVATAADTNISSNVYSLVAVIFGLLSTFLLVSVLVPRVLGYVILGIAWISAAIFLAVYQDGRLIMDPGRLIYNKFMQPVFEKVKNQFSPPTSSSPCSPSAEQQPKAASNA